LYIEDAPVDGSPSDDKLDPPVCRVDLIRKAAADGRDCQIAFDWISDREALRVQNAGENRGLMAMAIREMAIEWILAGNKVSCVRETREGFRDRRHFHYDIVIDNLPDFPRGLYVYMQLSNRDEESPTVELLNAHPQRG
jgi:hypothetical protein